MQQIYYSPPVKINHIHSTSIQTKQKRETEERLKTKKQKLCIIYAIYRIPSLCLGSKKAIHKILKGKQDPI